MFVQGGSPTSRGLNPRPPGCSTEGVAPLHTPDLILYVNLVAKGAPKFFKTLAPRLTVLDIPYLADTYSRTVRPIDLHNF